MEDQVFDNDNLSFEVAASEASTNSYNDPHSEIETSSKNGNDESVVYDDGSEAPDVIATSSTTTTTRTKRKKYTLACIASLALLALIIGLSAGLSDRKNRSSAGNRSSEASAANSALTLDECLAEAKADELEESELVESELVESSFGIPTNMPVSSIIEMEESEEDEMEESEEEEESRDEEETTVAATYSNDMSQLLGVRRDLRGSSSSSSRNIIEQRSPRSILKGKESFSRSKSRRLQCEDLIAGAASNKSSNMKKKKKKKQKGKSLVAVVEPFSQTTSPVTTSSSFRPISWNSEVNSKIVETGCKNCYSLPRGIATINYNEDGSFLFAVDYFLAYLPGAVTAIVDATSCDEVDENFFFHTLEPITSPEEFEKQIIYHENVDGFSNNASRIDNGFLAEDNVGYAILILLYDSPGILGCGVLGYASDNEPSDKMLLKATMGVYPNYMPGLTVSGSVTVAYRNDGTFKFLYDLEGVEPACADGSCGIHIHAGTSCDTHAEVLGHGWNSDVVQDLWTEEGGAVYVADEKGNAKGFFNLYNGFSFGKNLGHAVVVHDHYAQRIACGVLEAIV